MNLYEDGPDGEQVEDADLDVLLARLPVIAAALADGYLDRTNSVHGPPGRRPCHR